MSDTFLEGLLGLAITAFIIYGALLAHMLFTTRKRFRVTCECGHRERTYSLSGAQLNATEHMMKCKGKAIVSPLPAADIAKAAE